MPGERTEAATPKRRAEARHRGQVARSPELSAAIVLTAGVVLLNAWADRFAAAFAEMTRGTFEMAANPALTPAGLRAAYLGAGLWFAETVGPLLLAVLGIGLLANLAQTGLVFSFTPLAPSFARLNPLTGMQRIFSARSLVELVKALGKMAVVGFIVYQALSGHVGDLIALTAEPLAVGVPGVLGLVYTVLIDAGLALLVIAGLDYAYQRYQFEKSIRMSKEDLREEYRQSEGSPQIKARLRQKQRQLARKRMMQEVPKATVVITNPTHLAVALRYDSAADAAPRVVAKGADFLAQQIKQVAADHDVPLVENQPLARALYQSVDLDEQIPADLYRAVAEVLAFIQVMRRRAAGDGGTRPHPVPLPEGEGTNARDRADEYGTVPSPESPPPRVGEGVGGEGRPPVTRDSSPVTQDVTDGR